MTTQSWRPIAWVLILSALFVNGCVSFNAFPHRAPAGSDVLLALGSGEGITKANTSVTFTYDSNPGNPIALTPDRIKSIFKMYPDKTSKAVLAPNGDQLAAAGGHEPWLVVMMLRIPGVFTPGTGKLQVTTGGTYPFGQYGPNSPHTFAFEVLPGSPSAFPLNYQGPFGQNVVGVLSDLEPLPQIIVKPPFTPGSDPWPTFGAIEMVINAPMQFSDASSVPNSSLRITTDDLFGASNKISPQVTWTRTGDQIKIMLVSPTGMRYIQSRLSIVIVPSGSLTGQYTAAPTIVSTVYYDLDGNVISGPAMTAALQ